MVKPECMHRGFILFNVLCGSVSRQVVKVHCVGDDLFPAINSGGIRDADDSLGSFQAVLLFMSHYFNFAALKFVNCERRSFAGLVYTIPGDWECRVWDINYPIVSSALHSPLILNGLFW